MIKQKTSYAAKPQLFCNIQKNFWGNLQIWDCYLVAEIQVYIFSKYGKVFLSKLALLACTAITHKAQSHLINLRMTIKSICYRYKLWLNVPICKHRIFEDNQSQMSLFISYLKMLSCWPSGFGWNKDTDKNLSMAIQTINKKKGIEPSKGVLIKGQTADSPSKLY